jgi:hypothetical protein
MPLFVWNNIQTFRVGAELAHIVGDDDSGQLGIPDARQEGLDSTQVVYTQGTDNYPCNVLNRLVNESQDYTVNIVGVDAAVVLDGPIYIEAVAGALLYKPDDLTPTGKGLKKGSTVWLYYDADGCFGTGYCTYDSATNQPDAPYPPDAILFHYLAVVDRLLRNARNIDNPERQANQDENRYRAERVPALKRRDVDSTRIGCRGTGTCAQIRDTNKCVIVTAATGTPASTQVRRLQELRDTVLVPTVLGRRLVSAIAVEYYRYSPKIADAIAADPNLRRAVRVFAVDRLIEWYMFTVAFMGDSGPGDVSRRTLWSQGSAARDTLLRTGCSSREIAASSAMLQDQDGKQALSWSADDGRGAKRQGPRWAIRYLLSAFNLREGRGKQGGSDVLDWALRQPLAFQWQIVAATPERATWSESRMEEFEKTVIAWLVKGPVRDLVRREDPANRAGVLGELFDTVLRRPDLQTALTASVSDGTIGPSSAALDSASGIGDGGQAEATA